MIFTTKTGVIRAYIVLFGIKNDNIHKHLTIRCDPAAGMPVHLAKKF